MAKLSENSTVFYPVLEENKSHLTVHDTKKPFSPNFQKIRAAQNIKHLFFPSRDIVARFPEDLDSRPRSQVLLGVKACDLRGIEVYDRVFLNGDPVDPFYKTRRDNTLIISADCPEPEESCFCNLVGVKPYAESIADVNISAVKAGYLLEPKSPKGTKFIEEIAGFVKNAAEKEENEREETRRLAVKILAKINDHSLPVDLPRRVEKMGSPAIREARDECVECFGCLHACPTCYCFLLNDYPKGSEVDRVRIWDACYYADYARVGGGANPRGKFDKRFWNRFQCKFNYFMQYEKFYACSGCGRCWLGCSARIDIRKILEKA
jgi:NAD-dependent dihydropyrimidine dehydrogenase PreA subunit